jgi:hypothetical protein
VVRGEINKLLTGGEYDPVVAIDWCMKLARIAEGYIAFEHPRVSPIEPPIAMITTSRFKPTCHVSTRSS